MNVATPTTRKHAAAAVLARAKTATAQQTRLSYEPRAAGFLQPAVARVWGTAPLPQPEALCL
ncbi:MAG: hypothetical protein NWE95_07380 [Candidatus Bathyarchaeota archaeon]|nr:hypothetical protein [Candidatus Bathyarchaeota archaeon]